jgi:hypothetical protein
VSHAIASLRVHRSRARELRDRLPECSHATRISTVPQAAAPGFRLRFRQAMWPVFR